MQFYGGEPEDFEEYVEILNESVSEYQSTKGNLIDIIYVKYGYPGRVIDQTQKTEIEKMFKDAGVPVEEAPVAEDRSGDFIIESTEDGRISEDEDEAVQSLLADIESDFDELLGKAVSEAYRIGSSFRGPGITQRIIFLLKEKLQEAQ